MSEYIDLKEVNSSDGAIPEKQGYFVRDEKHIFYTLYQPAEKSTTGIVLVSPFAEEKVRTLRIFVSLSRALAKLGMCVLYFDYYGDGDSEGDFEEASFDDRLQDVAAAVEFLKRETEISSVGLLGLRWGATLAALVSEEISLEFLILWEPVIDTDRYFFDHLRSNVASQMLLEGRVSKNREAIAAELEAGGKVTVEGYNINGGFFVEARNRGLAGRKFDFKGKTLIVQISRNISKVRQELIDLESAFQSSEIMAVPKEFEWEKTETWNPAPAKLFTSTLDFLATNGFLNTVNIDHR